MHAFAIVFALLAVASAYSSGVVETCSGWRLNAFPEIKAFLKTPGGVDRYPDVTVKYISGHNPDLVIDGAHRIDLTKHKTVSQLHALFAARGFRTTEDSPEEL